MPSKAALKKKFKTHAKRRGIRINPNKEKVEDLIEGLLKNKEKYGELYCPCRPVVGKEAEDKDKICPCKWHIREIKRDGHCKCGLFVSEDGARKAGEILE